MIDEISTIYHYCSVATFLKILESNSIFMSHCRMLNDGNEDRTFLVDLEKATEMIQCDDEERKYIRMIVETYKRKVDFPYVACFSKENDLLPQWIAYADNGEGVAIGIDMSQIPYHDLLCVNHNGGSKFMIDEVVYYDDNTEFMCKLMNTALINLRRGDSVDKVIFRLSDY